MTRRILLCTTALFVGIAGPSAFAQSEWAGPHEGAGKMPSVERGGGEAGQMPRGERGMSEEGSDGSKGEANPESRSDRGQPEKSREAQDKTSPKSKAAGDTAKSEEGRSGKGRDAQDKQAQDKATQDKTGQDKTGAKSKGSDDTAKSESKSDADRSAASGRSEGTEGRGDQPGGSVTQLSSEQRTQVQSSFRSHKSDATVKDIDVRINVGVVVPRTVVLYAVPADVVVIVPSYRSYKYFIVDDQVVIVDPVTYAIIDVIVLT
ncbi:DUF1236 domain-containing protein [Hyphomicrobium sp. LHD-15]|uniref:DUF1236 domain-containing protein n=1 Tax=Hyphomicrobium sp. LHD-15 TaxID=3072142 RepID=UPI00280D3C5C|nr:DUF1236 domain-containing protein [Hyphomicrobium sp. LHD-15]MDQ8700204.1 DUF1236 domain-containing protein [Hyphomicrobium sp. LHD-15]